MADTATSIEITLSAQSGVTVTPKMKAVTVELLGTKDNVNSWIKKNVSDAENYSLAWKTRKTVSSTGAISETDYAVASITYKTDNNT